jgi:hypothetical protein
MLPLMAAPLSKSCCRSEDVALLPLRLVVFVVIVSALQFTTPEVVTMHAAFAFCCANSAANNCPMNAVSNASRRRPVGRPSGMNRRKCLTIFTPAPRQKKMLLDRV